VANKPNIANGIYTKVLNGIFYLTKNGCMWRDLPCEYPPWQTVYFLSKSDSTRERFGK